MRWNHALAYFWSGFFLANCIPHLVAGMSGSAFQSPFASPPGQGLSSATVNVCWGVANLFVGYLLGCRVGDFSARNNKHAALFFSGFAISALVLSYAFGRLHGGNL